MKRSALRAAIDREGPSPEARAVWWAIAAHADADGDAWPNLHLIARMAGMSTRHVSTKLRELEGFGMLETTRMPNRRNRYHVVTSAEPQFSFPAAKVLNPSSARAEPQFMNNLNPSSGGSSIEEVHEEGAVTFPNDTNGSAATPLRGGGTECTNCRKPIVFATLRSGRRVALDPEPDPSGCYVLLGDDRAFELGAYQGVPDDIRGRLRRRHADVCEQVSALADVLGATRQNTWREESRARKLAREIGR